MTQEEATAYVNELQPLEEEKYVHKTTGRPVEIWKISSTKDLKEENNYNIVISSIALDAESDPAPTYIIEYADYFFAHYRMTYKLFLDDLRTVDMVYTNWTDEDFTIVRNFEDFRKTIIEQGLPEYISFDNDLGLDDSGNVAPDGYAAAKWLVYESGLDLSDLEFFVHSANPVAAKQIQGLLENYIKHLRRL